MGRLVKWVGSRPRLKPDGWQVADWKWENRRAHATYGTERMLWPVHFEQAYPTEPSLRIGREYHWHYGNDFIVDVDDADADVILRMMPNQFKDVSREREPTQIGPDIVIVTPRGWGKPRERTGPTKFSAS